jgi:hypothetical protein
VFSIAAGLSGRQNSDKQEIRLRQELADRLRVLPEVASVSEAFNQPLSGSIGTRLARLGNEDAEHLREAHYNSVSAEFFETLSIQITKGRAFSRDEVRSGMPVVVVSEMAARQFWPGQDPVGQKIALQAEVEPGLKQTAGGVSYNEYEVIGVARDTRSRHLWQRDESFMYLPLTEAKSRYLLVQTRTNPTVTMSGVRELAASLDPALRTSVRRLDDSVNVQAAPFRALAWLSAVLGLLALVLASLGLYGVTSFLVARRTHEIGIRMALGARGSDVVALFLRGGLRLTGLGVALGVGGGVVLSRLLVAVLVDLSPLDPFVFVLGPLFLFAVATVTILAATRRATQVDPMVALRYE